MVLPKILEESSSLSESLGAFFPSWQISSRIIMALLSLRHLNTLYNTGSKFCIKHISKMLSKTSKIYEIGMCHSFLLWTF